MYPDFQSMMGPGDKALQMDTVSGYQPVSRIGEVVMNAFGAPARRAPAPAPAPAPAR